MRSIVQTSMGPMTVEKAVAGDESAVLAVMRDAAEWLKERGVNQWNGMLTPKGPELVDHRVKTGVAYLAALNGEKMGTVAILWEDVFVWDEKGRDGLAGYIHGLAVLRKYAGKNLGREILKWAMDEISAQRPAIRLDCMAENPRLCHYYEELGFLNVGQKSYPNGWKSNLYEMKG